MVAVDTNVLIRIIAKDDPGQASSAKAFIEQGVWVSLVVLAETVWVLSSLYGRTAAEITTMLSMLLDNETLTLQESDSVAEALNLFRARPSLGFMDCLILQLARKAGHLPLGTFDRNLSKLEGAQKL